MTGNKKMYPGRTRITPCILKRNSLRSLFSRVQCSKETKKTRYSEKVGAIKSKGEGIIRLKSKGQETVGGLIIRQTLLDS